jgi:micrococcal nuclease
MYEYRCELVRVVDGDTVDVDIDLGFGVWLRKERIRLYGVDTPESRTRDKTEKKFGKIASEVVQEYLDRTDTLILRTDQYDAVGKFGRIVGRLYNKKDTTSINDYLIQNNYAAPYYGQSKDEIAGIHLANREKLYEAGLVSRDSDAK